MSGTRDFESSYKAFMSMGDSEWQGLLMSVRPIGTGVLEPEEEKAFQQAFADRLKRKAQTITESMEI